MPRSPPPVDALPVARNRGSRRGTYNRLSTPSERVKGQRVELLAAVRHLTARGEALTVTSIAGARGMGRNTFYEHFPTVEAATAACVKECVDLLVEAVHSSQDTPPVATPGERSRALGAALHQFRQEYGDRWRVMLIYGQTELASVLGFAVERVHQAYVAAGAGRAEQSPLMAAGATGALLGLLAEAERRQYPESQVVEELASVLGRLLR